MWKDLKIPYPQKWLRRVRKWSCEGISVAERHSVILRVQKWPTRMMWHFRRRNPMKISTFTFHAERVIDPQVHQEMHFLSPKIRRTLLGFFCVFLPLCLNWGLYDPNPIFPKKKALKTDYSDKHRWAPLPSSSFQLDMAALRLDLVAAAGRLRVGPSVVHKKR